MSSHSMADPADAYIAGRDLDHLRAGRGELAAQQFDRGAGREIIVRETHRAQRAGIVLEIPQRRQTRIVEHEARLAGPVRPLVEHALRHVGAEAEPAGQIAENARGRLADIIHQRIEPIAFRRFGVPPVAGLRRDQQRAGDVAIVRDQTQRLAAETVADIGEREVLVMPAHPRDRSGSVAQGPVRQRGVKARQRLPALRIGNHRAPGSAGPAVIIGQHDAAAAGQIRREIVIQPARRAGRGIDEDRVVLAAARQEQRSRQREAVHGRHDDIVDEYVIGRSARHAANPRHQAATEKANFTCGARGCRRKRFLSGKPATQAV